jgi:transcription antitermination protein NusB
MPARRRSRQRALQVLFQCDMRKLPADVAIQNYYESLYSAEDEGAEEPLPPQQDSFMETLVQGTWTHAPEFDELITKRAEHWRLERMPVVDRNILRMAIYEMRECGTPPPVVIDEALELARRYSEEDAIPFINGVLDAVRKLILPESVEP